MPQYSGKRCTFVNGEEGFFKRRVGSLGGQRADSNSLNEYKKLKKPTVIVAAGN